MAESKKNEQAPEAVAALQVAPTSKYKLVGLDGQQEIFVPLTNRSYVLSQITEDQLDQLHALKFPHVQLVQPERGTAD